MGPESTGKSSMSQKLADHYHAPWVPEYAREYCEKLKGPAQFEDEVAMLQGQLALEDLFLASHPRLLFCDTMFLTVKIYSEYVFGTYPKELDQELKTRTYDFFLIMNTDLPWENDPLREFPQLQSYFLDIHIREIKNLGVPYQLISGQGKTRFENAIQVLDPFLKNNS